MQLTWFLIRQLLHICHSRKSFSKKSYFLEIRASWYKEKSATDSLFALSPETLNKITFIAQGFWNLQKSGQTGVNSRHQNGRSSQKERGEVDMYLYFKRIFSFMTAKLASIFSWKGMRFSGAWSLCTVMPCSRMPTCITRARNVHRLGGVLEKRDLYKTQCSL